MRQVAYLAAVIAAGAELCSGQIVLNGSFETGAAPPFGGTFIPAPDATSLPGWTVQNGSVDYIGNDTWQAADGRRALDMSGHSAGTITQNISGFTVGQCYRLSFYLAGNNDGATRTFHLQAQIAAVTETFAFDASGYKYPDMGWSLRTLDFTATDATLTLSFTSLEDGNAGPALDQVSIAAVPASDCVVPPADLVGWWRGEGNANDAAAGNDGMPFNDVTFADGLMGQALNFDGTNAYVEVPDAPGLRLTNELTIEFWVQRQRLTFPTSPYSDYIVEKGGDWTGGMQNYGVALHNPQYNHCLHFTFAGGWRGAGSIADFNWHHCAVVARHGQADPTFYIDGVPQPVVYREGAATINLHPSTLPLHIGAQLDPNTGWFYYSKTRVDELALYRRALSANEIQDLYNAGGQGKCPPQTNCVVAPTGLAAWWPAESNATEVVSGTSGSFEPAATFAAGKTGFSFDFRGENNVVDADRLALNPTNAITIECWVKPRRLTTSYAQDLVSKDAEFGGPRQYLLSLGPPPGLDNGTGGFRAHVGVPSAGGGLVFIDGATRVQINTWYHVAMTYDGAVLRLFVNGQLDAQRPVTGPIIVTPQPVRLGGGAPAGSPAYYFSGLLDEVSLYSRALSETEIHNICARSEGKCKAPPVIVMPPASQRITVGSNVTFGVVASGTPQLRYQWRFNSDPVPSVTGSTLTFTATESSGGLYSVRITNSFGSVISSNAWLTLNHAPVPDARATKSLFIVPVGCPLTVEFDASRSTDSDGDSLRYRWFKTGRSDVFAVGAVAAVNLPMGTHSITLLVDDGLASAAQTFTIELITPMQAVERLMALVNFQARKSNTLLATLSAALASFERGNLVAACNQLEAFQNRVRFQVMREDGASAAQFINFARDIIVAVIRDCASGAPRGRIGKVQRNGAGNVRMGFSAPPGQPYLVEASTNLVNWERIGVAVEKAPGEFEYEDFETTGIPARFYRIIVP